MNKKIINFDYKGGEHTQKININGENLPWRYENDSTWLKITQTSNSLIIYVEPTYDFETRKTTINIFDKFNNQLILIVEQTGYQDLEIICTPTIIIYENYYQMYDNFKSYITIYGGSNQEITCPELNNYITKVWDNSALYNDFVLTIPNTLQGTYNIKHKDFQRYKTFCKKNNIPFNTDKLSKDINIIQIKTQDIIGNCIIKINNQEYKNGDKYNINIEYNNPITIDIIKTEFTHIKSHTEYEIINNMELVAGFTPYWLNITTKNKQIILSTTEKNNFSDRQVLIRLSNPLQPHQYIELNITQEENK
jgi:predicted transcriptional regulator